MQNMSYSNEKGIQVYDDGAKDLDIMRKIINNQNQEDAFYILDVGNIIQKHKEWIKKIPRVIPHYGMIFQIL